MSLKKQALKGIFWTFFQQFGVQGITFFVSIILARFLKPEEFGLIGMISIIFGIGNVFINSGLTQSLLRTIDADEQDFSTVFFFNFLISILIYIIMFWVAPLIAEFYNQNILILIIRVYSITFITNSLTSIQITKLSLKLDFRSQALISIPSTFISGIVGIIMAYLGYGVWSLVSISVLQSIILAFQIYYFDKWTPVFAFNQNKFIKHWKFGSRLILSGFLDNIFSNVYSIIIGKVYTVSQVGFYQRAEALKNFPVSNLSSIINRVSYPILASIQNDDQRLRLAYKITMQMVIFIIAPTLVLLAVLAEPLIKFLFSEKWLPTVPFFQILCVNGILYPIHAYNLNVLNVKGRTDLFFKLEVVKNLFLIVIIIISFNWGIYGLLYSTIVSSVISFFINSFYTGKLINYNSWRQVKDLFPTLVVSIISGLVVYYFKINYFNLIKNDIAVLFFGISLGITIFLFISRLLRLEALNEFHRILFPK